MQEATTKDIYDFQSSFYDVTFGRLVRKRIAKAIGHLNVQASDVVLDLGIGTGASLNYYPRGQIVGIDLSIGMLRHADKRIRNRGLSHVHLVQANALQLPFADDSFDKIFISHVISVVSDPCQLIREAQRVAKPGARIVIVNHFQSPNRLIAMVEKLLCPLCSKIGWRSDLVLHDIVEKTGIEVAYRYKLDNIDLWETVVFSNEKSSEKSSVRQHDSGEIQGVAVAAA